MGQLKKMLACLFQIKRKTELPKNELVFAVAFDHKWFSPKQATDLIEFAQLVDLIKIEDGVVKLNFNANKIQVDPSFKPSEKLVDLPLFEELVNEISETIGMPEKQVISQINEKHMKFGNMLSLEVAAILFAREKNVDVTRFLPAIKQKF